MNRSLNVFFGVLVCVGLIVGLFVWTKRSMSDSDKLNPYDFYNSVAGATYSVGGFGGVGMADGGLTVPMRSSSSMFRYRGASSYAPAYTAPNSLIASSPNGPIASSPITYTSSSATMKSFGGGNAMGGGVSMSGGAVSSAHNSPIASSPSGLLASSPNSLIASSPITSSPNFSIYATQSMGSEVYSAAGIYAGMGTNDGTARGVRGRQNSDNAPSVSDSWLIWLSQHTNFGTQGEGGWYFDQYQLYKAWQEYCAKWNVTMGPCPTWEQWLAWFAGGGSHTWGSGENQFNAHFVPIGSVLPLLLVALLYALLVFIKSKKNNVKLLTAQRSNNKMV